MSKHSEWKQRALDRRDFRSARDEPEVPRYRKKGTGKKVCKKNKNGPHVEGHKIENAWYSVSVCKFCGHMKYYFPRR